MHGIERMRLFRALALVGCAFLLLAHAAVAQSVTPCGIVDSYERAWGQQDLVGAQAQLADDAVIRLEDAHSRLLAGRAQIHDFLQGVGLQGVPVLTAGRRIEGDTVIWSERSDGQILNSPDVTVEATILNGKIQSLIYRPGTLVQTAGSPANDLSPVTAATVLGGVVLLGLGLLSLASVRQRVSSGSNLRGSLLRDLRHWRAASRWVPPPPAASSAVGRP
jgi:hypothetical protein